MMATEQKPVKAPGVCLNLQLELLSYQIYQHGPVHALSWINTADGSNNVAKRLTQANVWYL